MPKDQILKSTNRKYLDTLNKKLECSATPEAAKIFYSIIFRHRETGPVDPKMKEIINQLQDKGIKVLALTNCFTGPFGVISSMEDWRYRELSANGYHFDRSWPELADKVFENRNNELSAKTYSKPIFYKGIVFTSAVSKGEALSAFLSYACFNPKKIIFIDDKSKHLESVQNVALAHNIQFLGIRYMAAEHKQTDCLNKTRADLQYEILEKHKKWTSDFEANKILQNPR